MAVGCSTYYSGCCCYMECTPAMCTDTLDVWADPDIPCGDISAGAGTGACFADEDMSPCTGCCADMSLPCTTNSGYDDGVCLSDGSNLYCLRGCIPDNDVCDFLHTCTPLTSSGSFVGGACIPI